MDPFSVSTACVGLLAAVAQLSTQIAQFVSGVREARRDMDAVSRELSSLALCLETLRDDTTKIQYPDGLRRTLVAVLGNCDIVTQQMHALMEKMSSGSLGRHAQWVATGRDEMNRLRSNLEAYKSALDIALDVTNLSIISAVKDDVKDVKADTAAIKEDTSYIPNIKQDTLSLMQEIAFLRLQVTELQQLDTGGGMILQRFMQESTTYAETVIDSLDEEEGSLNLLSRSGSAGKLSKGAAPAEGSKRVISADENTSEVSDNSFGLEGVTNRINSLTESPNLQSTEQGSRSITPDLNYAQQPLSGPRARKSPNREAIRVAAAARKGLTEKAKKSLDERLEVLLRGKKPNLPSRVMKGFKSGTWFGDEVGGLQEIRPVLQAGGVMPYYNTTFSPVLERALVLELIIFQRLGVVELLLSYGALGDEPTALIEQKVIWKIPIPLMQSLLEYWDNLNLKSRQGTALYMCASRGATAHVSLLLRYGADPNLANFQTASEQEEYGFTCRMARYGTPLNVACFYGHVDTVKVLLENGTEFNSTAGFPPRTPAQCLAERNYIITGNETWTDSYESIKKMLISAGAREQDFDERQEKEEKN